MQINEHNINVPVFWYDLIDFGKFDKGANQPFF
ncbi:MAG: hypothetical protein ACI8QQ_002056 [Psychroserpens sp.]|jgi:hypothetical protein